MARLSDPHQFNKQSPKMKLLIISCALICAMAEPPRFRPARFRFQRQELAPTTDMPETTTDSAPYPASGWKPSGAPFTLPQEQTPTDSYGAPAPYPASGWKPNGQAFTLPQDTSTPDNSYGPPANTYGAPTTDASQQVEKLEGPVDVQKSAGIYYVLLPNGELQRVEFVNQNDFQKMKYTARLQLRERAPLFVFGP